VTRIDVMKRALHVAVSGCIALSAFAASAQQPQQPSPPAQQQPGAPAPDGGERVTVIGIVPVPDVGDGAPYLSVEDLGAIENQTRRNASTAQSDARSIRICRLKGDPLESRLSYLYPSLEALLDEEVSAGNRVAIEAGRAQEATKAAEQARLDAAGGKVDMKAVETAELARQAAIAKLDEARIKYLEAGAAIADFQDLERRGRVVVNAGSSSAPPSGIPITWSDLEARARRRRDAGWWLGIPVPEPEDGLSIQRIEAHERTEKGKRFVEVTGQIRNDLDKAASVPELVISALDSRGFVLLAQPATAGSGARIPARAARNFAFEVRPSPEAISTVTVSFSSKIAPPPRMRIERPNC
jgi:hypothetical protein